MIYLDTHVVVWLYAGLTEKFSALARTLINEEDVYRPFNRVVTQAIGQSWTRDPFDRLIVAQAALQDNILLSKDETILRNYAYARWT